MQASNSLYQPCTLQGTSGRFTEKEPTRDVPGAGSYASNYACTGKQTLSTKQTLPSPKIGTSTRDGTKKVRAAAAAPVAYT